MQPQQRVVIKAVGSPRLIHTYRMDQARAAYSFNDHALLRLHEAIKDTLDPVGIFSPGKNGIWPRHMRGDKA